MIIVAWFMYGWLGINGLGITAMMWLASLWWLDERLTKREMRKFDEAKTTRGVWVYKTLDS